MRKEKYLNNWRQYHDRQVAEERVKQWTDKFEDFDHPISLVKIPRKRISRQKADEYFRMANTYGNRAYEKAAQLYALLGDYKKAEIALEEERKQAMGRTKYHPKEFKGHDEKSPPEYVLKLDTLINALETLSNKNNKRRPKDSELEGFLSAAVVIGGAFLLLSFILSLNKLTGFAIINKIQEATNNYLSIIFFLIGLVIVLVGLQKINNRNRSIKQKPLP